MNDPYPGELAAEHVLADGTRIGIRPIRPEDAELERAFVDGLSARSRYLRFQYSMKSISPKMVARFTDIDYEREMALIALNDDADGERQIAVARYVTNPDGHSCEFAIVVADEWQGRGIATELLRRIIRIASAQQFDEISGVVLRENEGMLRLARDLGFEKSSVAGDPHVVVLTLRL